MEENKQTGKQNYFLGSIGAIIGALAGSIIWIILRFWGWYTVIGGAAISFCSFMGYKILGGKKNKIAIIIVSVFTLCVIFIAELFLTVIEVGRNLDGTNVQLSLIQIIELIFGKIDPGDIVNTDLTPRALLSTRGQIELMNKIQISSYLKQIASTFWFNTGIGLLFGFGGIWVFVSNMYKHE